MFRMTTIPLFDLARSSGAAARGKVRAVERGYHVI
jgi:hypothetical protein